MLWRVNSALYFAINKPCPTDAEACWVARSVGRSVNPSGAIPAAIAAEVTIITSLP